MTDESKERIPPAMRRLQESMVELKASPDTNNRLAEDTFVKTYLMGFAGGEGYLNVHNWLQVSGGYYREVDIFDNSGKIIFKVPALSIPVVPDETVNEWGRVAGDLKTKQENLLRSREFDVLVDKFNPNYKTPLEEIKARWEAIFKRYNIDVVGYRTALLLRSRDVDPESPEGQEYIRLVKEKIEKENAPTPAGPLKSSDNIALDEDGAWGAEPL